jgi:integrase/recombinase XerC
MRANVLYSDPMTNRKPTLENFAEHLTDAGRAEHTVAGYVQDLRVFARWFEQTNGEPLAPDKLTSHDARAYRARLLKQKAAAATINRQLAALRAYVAWAVENKWIEANPLSGIKQIEQQKLAPKWLEKKEQTALLREAERDVLAAKTQPAKRLAIRNQAIVTVLLHTSLRVSELCALEMSDVKTSERKGTLRVRQGKGNKQRDIPLNAVARAAFQDWFAVRTSLPPLVGGAGGGHKTVPNVFTGRDGKPLTSSGVERMLSHLARRADVEVTPHTLRHTFAKNLVNSGVSLEKVAALMGHSNLNTTSIYTIPSALDLEHAVAQIGE